MSVAHRDGVRARPHPDAGEVQTTEEEDEEEDGDGGELDPVRSAGITSGCLRIGLHDGDTLEAVLLAWHERHVSGHLSRLAWW